MPDSPADPVPQSLVRTLDRTRPWVRFFAVLGSIGVGLMALAGVVFLFLGGVFYREVPLASRLLGVLYLVLGGVTVYPVLLLHQVAGRMRDFVASGSVEDLEGALELQAAFWKGYGIITIVAMGVGLVGSVVALAIAPFWLQG